MFVELNLNILQRFYFSSTEGENTAISLPCPLRSTESDVLVTYCCVTNYPLT